MTFALFLFPLSSITEGAWDCNQNGVDDAQDLAGGKSPDCNANGVPDECDLASTHLGFDPPRMVPLSSGPREYFRNLVPADFDGDGRTDLAVRDNGVCPLSVHFNLTERSPSGDRDRDGIPDECQVAGFRRGDADGSGAIDLTDAISFLYRIFLGGEPLACEDAADANDDGEVNLSDPISILNMLFLGAGPLPPPGPEHCGADLTPDGLACGRGGCN